MSSAQGSDPQQRIGVDVVVPFVGSDHELSAVAARLNALRVIADDTLTIADNRPTAAPTERSIGATAVRPAAGRPTSYFARNRGVEQGRNPWILFLDADVEPPSDLIDRYRPQDVGPSVAILAGGIADAEPGPTAAEQYSFVRGALSHANTTTRKDFRFAQTANVMIRRSALDEVGGFREDVRSGGDADLCFRIQRAGYAMEPRFEAAVRHQNRSTVRSFFRQYARYGAGSAWLEGLYPGFSPRPRPLRVLRGIAGSIVGAVLAALRRDRVGAQVRLMDAVENTASYVGRFASNVVPGTEGVAAPDRSEVRA